MANAAINILGDGSICSITTIHGNTENIAVVHVTTGVYELHGTLGMVPAPDGWGVVTNPLDQISAAVSFNADVLRLETNDATHELIDIPSRVTLHIVVEDAQAVTLPPLPTPDPAAEAIAECSRLRSLATEAIQLLQDVVDIGEGTEVIAARILAWKRFRVALSRVAEQPDWPFEVEWPPLPE